ncbi:MAG: hypothetical protein J6333_01810, partial [Planctomycetes bacterium]|nr:hypothetical protein [Planctomycetota bacterium]
MAHEQTHALGGADHDLSALFPGFVTVVSDPSTGAKSLATNPGGTYILPPATATDLGGVKRGAGLAVAIDGLVSVALPTLTKETITSSGPWTAP